MFIDQIRIGDNLKLKYGMPNESIWQDGNGQYTDDDIVTNDEYGFIYIPYRLDAINNAKLDRVARNMVSSPFSGCLLVAWQTWEGVYVGHVSKDEVRKEKTPSFIKWNQDKEDFLRYAEFRPSDYIDDTKPLNACYGLLAFSNVCNTVTGYCIGTEAGKIAGDTIVNQIHRVDLEWVNNPYLTK